MTDDALKAVLTSRSDLNKTKLATRLLIGRLRQQAAHSADNLDAGVRELRNFMAQHPFAEADLNAI